MTTAMWQPELPFTTASPSASQASEKDSRELPDSCSSTFERYVNSVHVGLSGRTSQERSQASGGRLIASSCQRWMRSGMVWHGEYWMRSFSVWPNDASVCSLLEVLEPCVARKYFLSAKACRGIISRADRRGKPLPKRLRDALEKQIMILGLTPGETQSRRVYPTSGVYPTLSTREKSGQNQESVFTQFGDDIAGTLTARYDSSPCVDRGANVVVDERDKVFLCQTAQTGSNGKLVKQDDVMNTLDRTNSTAVAALDFNPTDARLRYAHDDVSQTLTARAGTGGNQVPLVQVQPIVFNPNAGINEQGGGFAVSEDVTPTLKTDHNPAVAFASNQRDEVRELEVAGALAAQPGIKQQTYICRADGQTNAMAGVNLAPTLTSHAKKDPPPIYPAEDSTGEDEPVTLQIRGGKPGGGKSALIQHDMSATLSTHNTRTLITGDHEERGLTVRRLTPRECERLQGFPDDYTDIPYRNKEHAPDGARYKALGNSMAVPVMRWIGERIQMVEETDETTE